MNTDNPKPSAGQGEQHNKEEATGPEVQDDQLDQALEDTFPASDPPATAARGITGDPRHQEKDRGKPQATGRPR